MSIHPDDIVDEPEKSLATAILEWCVPGSILLILAGWLLFGWLFAGCAHAPDLPYTPRPTGQWSPAAYPIDLRLSPLLTRCQRAGIRAAAEWHEVQAGQRLFYVSDAAADDVAILGMPGYRQVAVVPGAMSRPGWLDETYVALTGAYLHSAVITVQGCSVQAFAHELGHALGLAHREQPGALMQYVHDPDGWDLAPGELAAERGEWLPAASQ